MQEAPAASWHPAGRSTADHVSLFLVLSGGSALGAYQAGGYQALHERRLRPDWIVGASTGAINGAIIGGNADDDRMARLAEFWSPAPASTSVAPALWWSEPGEDARRTAAVGGTLAVGQPKVFVPRSRPGRWWGDFFGDERHSLYDTAPLTETLGRMVDFDRLNSGSPRFTATAVDLESGESAVFDTRDVRMDADHIRASSALLPVFSPVEIDGRIYGDGGLSANLPLDVVLSQAPARQTLCLALDLMPLAAPRPRTLGEAASRAQDLMFAAQSQRTIAGWQALHAGQPTATPGITLVHLSYRRQEGEVAGKAFDFSPQTARQRWDAGHADVSDALDRLENGEIKLAETGLTVWRPPAN